MTSPVIASGEGAAPDTRARPAGPPAGTDARGDPVVLAEACWPQLPGDVLPGIPGFVTSSFSPLVAEVANRCLRSYFGEPPADPARGGRTGILVASATGDVGTAAAVADAVDHGRRVPPLLFFQSNHNAVAGHIAARWGLGGPVLCTIPRLDALADAWVSAELLIDDGDTDAVLIVIATQARTDSEAGYARALLAGPESWPPPVAAVIPPPIQNG